MNCLALFSSSSFLLPVLALICFLYMDIFLQHSPNFHSTGIWFKAHSYVREELEAAASGKGA